MKIRIKSKALLVSLSTLFSVVVGVRLGANDLVLEWEQHTAKAPKDFNLNKAIFYQRVDLDL